VNLAPAGDAGLMIRFPGGISAAGFDRVFGALAALQAARADDWIDLVPGYASILIVIDPVRTTPAAAAALARRVLRGANKPAASAAPAHTPRRVEIPVWYDPAVAPDLEALAADKSLAIADLVARHTAVVYRCHMLGFRPGFPFLGGLDPVLATPRLATPRLAVAAGSVGVAGQQTGIYPSRGPGGWRIIGRTPLVLFDPTRPDPCLVHPGDQVAFVPIDQARFAALAPAGLA
jgi:inhibitor of KinA